MPLNMSIAIESLCVFLIGVLDFFLNLPNTPTIPVIIVLINIHVMRLNLPNTTTIPVIIVLIKIHVMRLIASI